nr:uncharacterized protein LOC129258382 [Lytechinus pictus]
MAHDPPSHYVAHDHGSSETVACGAHNHGSSETIARGAHDHGSSETVARGAHDHGSPASRAHACFDADLQMTASPSDHPQLTACGFPDPPGPHTDDGIHMLPAPTPFAIPQLSSPTPIPPDIPECSSKVPLPLSHKDSSPPIIPNLSQPAGSSLHTASHIFQSGITADIPAADDDYPIQPCLFTTAHDHPPKFSSLVRKALEFHLPAPLLVIPLDPPSTPHHMICAH